ncbi:hypothetical protein N7456_006358 [Penicillium angulare]|uniref:Mitochondrial intermembrane space import and assembly protein 40 n=1 Tax=Penicillium angulare TaxID=116970 RepID=A0A9W9KC44_9EURO|nr:hypothetical protein N7456_006358 [Penicillium angulare]
MFRPAVRALARAPAVARTPANTRLISTGPTPKSRSLKSTVLRLGLAGGAIYYYNNSSVFSEEPSCPAISESVAIGPNGSLRTNTNCFYHCIVSVLSYLQEDTSKASSQTLDSITPKIREERAAAQAKQGGVNPQQLEEEADQQAAFNPETGEINWDCPCLGGMAHGPCGDAFKAAFSCFVYSEEEPKGMDCIEKFKDMQDCFRQYPDVYGAELEDDEPAGPEGDAPAPAPASPEQSSPATEQKTPAQPIEQGIPAAATEGDVLVPKAAHDAEQKNEQVEKTEK